MIAFLFGMHVGSLSRVGFREALAQHHPVCVCVCVGLPPFYDENTNQMYHKILFGDLEFTEEVPPDGCSLITGVRVCCDV